MSVINDVVSLCESSRLRGKGGLIRQVIPCFWGDTGTGKTQQIITWCQENDYHLNIVHVGSMESPADLIGMPDRDPATGKTKYLLPDWFDFDHDKVFILFDEINRGNILLQQALFPVLGDYMVGPHKIPEKVLMSAAANPPTQEFNVTEMDSALVNRMWHVPVETSVEQWVGWAEDRIQKDLVDFVEFHESSGAVTKNVISLGQATKKKKKDLLPILFPSGKSWEMVDLLYSPTLKKGLTKLIFDGLLGPGIFEAFYPFQKNPERPLNPKDVVEDYLSVQGHLLKWGSRTYNRVDLLDLTLQRLARYIIQRKKSLPWAFVYVVQAVQGQISTLDIINRQYSLSSPGKKEDSQYGFLQFLNDLSGENLRSLQVLLNLSV